MIALLNSPTRRTRRLLATILLAAACIVTLLPYVWLLCASLKSNSIFFDSLLLPGGDGPLGLNWSGITIDHYIRLFRDLDFGRSLVLSVFYSSVTSLLATLACAMAGYALARLRFRGKWLITTIVLGAVLIPAPLLLAPGYLLLYKLSLLDTMAAVILPAAAPAFGVYLFRQATISSVPPELIESARIDGAGDLKTFFVIALPLLRPMVGTFLMITFLGVWNNFITPQVVLQDPTKFPVAVSIAQLRGVYYQDYGLQMAGTLAAIFPLLALFAFLQREFIAGLTAGAVKA
ncbi:MAG: carbohydrate ABC transporter permease [Phycisphaerales bacterium]|nr:carbohydrate ABC transporter permease [Phycisphaerales bacterium]